MAFHLFMSNSLERLAELFQEHLCFRSKDPFVPVRAVVANNGMGFFLKRTLARKGRLGIAAHIECAFLQEFISSQVRNILPPKEAEDYGASLAAWSPSVLSWRIDAVLTRDPGRFPRWREYWEGKGGEGAAAERRHILSCELAEALYRYQLYRRKKLDAWRQGGDPGSPQAELFRILCEEVPDPDSFHAAFLSSTGRPLREKLPGAVGVFGIGAMPEFYLQCLRKLAESAEV